MDWIRIETSLPDHPKVGRLARRLKCERSAALAVIVRLLCWVGRSKERGNLNGTDPEDLAEACHWDGDPEALVKALEGAGWLDLTPDGLAVHEWMDRQGGVFKHRERVAKAASRLTSGCSQTAHLRTDVRTDEKTTRTRTRERDRSPAGAGAVARTYREWEPPR